MATGNDTLNNLMASSAAALCSRLCTHPLDTVKTRVQVANTPQHLFPTFLHLLRTGGLYRGLPIALTLSVPGLSVYLTTYDAAKNAFSKQFPGQLQDSVANHMLSAGVAEVCSGLFWTPMEVLKQKQQIETGSRMTSSTLAAPAQQQQSVRTKTLDLAKMIYRQEGLAGFYRGYFITLGVFVPYSMLYFASYEQLKQMAWTRKQRTGAPNIQEQEMLSFLTIVGCAAVACGFAAGVSNIVDVVKTRWQTSVLTKNTELSSTRKIAEAMFQQGGLASFTRGMGARILWMVPSVAISMSTFEWFKFHGFA
ncbi:hypothetical protein CPB97_005122 [Podila verticillata]|nr:hypothetical protein CPB97_005122 [Podila verticillata]